MIAIVTDSSVGYSTAEIADRGIVSVVPLNYNVGGNNFEEKASDKNGAFMPAIESAPCKTAQPALASFIQTFSSLVAKGCDVICIVLSSSLSGTYSSAKFAAGQVGEPNYKGELQEYLQGKHLPLAEYSVIARTGAAHAPHFTVSVSGGGAQAEGEGASLREAEKQAAKRLLRHLSAGEDQT